MVNRDAGWLPLRPKQIAETCTSPGVSRFGRNSEQLWLLTTELAAGVGTVTTAGVNRTQIV